MKKKKAFSATAATTAATALVVAMIWSSEWCNMYQVIATAVVVCTVSLKLQLTVTLENYIEPTRILTFTVYKQQRGLPVLVMLAACLSMSHKKLLSLSFQPKLSASFFPGGCCLAAAPSSGVASLDLTAQSKALTQATRKGIKKSEKGMCNRLEGNQKITRGYPKPKCKMRFPCLFFRRSLTLKDMLFWPLPASEAMEAATKIHTRVWSTNV